MKGISKKLPAKVQQNLRRGTKRHPQAPSSEMAITHRETQLEGMRQAVELLSGNPTTTGEGGQYTGQFCGPYGEQGGQNRIISIETGLPGEANPHELLHVLETPFNETDPQIARNSLLRHIENLLEDERIDLVGDAKWPGLLVTEVKHESMRANLVDPTHGNRLERLPHMLDTLQDAAMTGLFRRVCGAEAIPSANWPEVEPLIDMLWPEIDAAIHGTYRDIVAVTLHIGQVFDMLRKQREEPEPRGPEPQRGPSRDEGEGEGDQGEGEAEGEGEEAGDEAGDKGEPDTGAEGEPGTGGGAGGRAEDEGETEGEAEGEGEGKSEGDGGDGDATPSDTSTTTTTTITYRDDDAVAAEEAADDLEPAPVDAQQDEGLDLRDLFDQAGEAGVVDIQRAMDELDRQGEENERIHNETIAQGTYSYPEGRADHRVLVSTRYPISPLVHGDEMLEVMAAAPSRQTTTQHERSGVLEPEDAWRAVLGDLRVFSRAQPAGARLVVLVDNSGSMDNYVEPEDRQSPWHRQTGATLAWEMVGALTARYPEAEVWTFWSDNEKTVVQPIPNGCRPFEARDGNDDCAALLWLRGYLNGDVTNTVVVVISDGYPTGNSTTCKPIKHTSQIAHEMADSGLAYISVLVNYGRGTAGLYPAEVEVTINGIYDFGKVGEAFARLDNQL